MRDPLSVVPRTVADEAHHDERLVAESLADSHYSRLPRPAAAAAESYSVIYAFDLNDRFSSTANGEPDGGATASDALNRSESIGGLAADTNGALITDAASRLDSALGAIGAPNNDYYILRLITDDLFTARRVKRANQIVELVAPRTPES